jgi:hypothetical protein
MIRMRQEDGGAERDRTVDLLTACRNRGCRDLERIGANWKVSAEFVHFCGGRSTRFTTAVSEGLTYS